MDAHTGEETISSKKVNGHRINPCGTSTVLKYGRESEVCKSNGRPTIEIEQQRQQKY